MATVILMASALFALNQHESAPITTSCTEWLVAEGVADAISGFIVYTRLKPEEKKNSYLKIKISYLISYFKFHI